MPEELQKQQIEAELSFLRGQINPHFFFNTLNNIYSLSYTDVELSKEALHKLSRMMRYLLYETQQNLVSLRKEVDFLKDHIALMSLRLLDNNQIEFREPKMEKDFMIAPMLLLPFVENVGSARESACKIVFTTAYNQFAVEGYQVDALYYLLKPFNYAEFLMAANKARNYFEQQEPALASSLPAVEEGQTLEERYLFLKVDYKLVRVDFDQILYVESYKDYVKVHTVKDDVPVMSLASLKSVMEKLPKNEFTRIHRSFVVANSKIDAISRNGVEIGRQHIPVGDQYKEDFKQLLQRWG